MRVQVPIDVHQPVDRHAAVDVLVNEKPAGRERRRGQLVLSGAHGEFVYQVGDRQDRHRLLHVQFADE